MKCAECSGNFSAAQLKQVFCSTTCKQTYHNRAAKRGKVLVPLVMAQRQGRNTPTGKQAHGEWARLVSQFTAEDKAAGRMSAHDFIRRQHTLFLRS